MIKRRLLALLATGALVTGVGTAVALADDNNPSGNGPTATCPTTITAPAPLDQQNAQQGDDELGTANDVVDAVDAVEQEADNQSADDQSGDQQGPNDNSEEPDDACQSGE